MNLLNLNKSPLFGAFIALTLGIIAFLVIVGWHVTNPSNISWLEGGDPETYYLGWLFYRTSPWSLPIGLNPGYGLEISNAIIYSDSNPLFSIFFKVFDPLLPTPFQYFGIWLLLCFILQSFFSWKLLSLVTENTIQRALGVCFFIFSPPMLDRLKGHLNLVGHFFIIAALYLYFNKKLQKRFLAWAILLTLTTLVHFYLFAMISAIWFADITDQRIKNKISSLRMAKEIIINIFLVTTTFWQAGYFSVQNGTSSQGFGLYRMNLLSIFDSSGWSYLLKDIPESAGDYEGFNYLGLGVILVFAVTLPRLASSKIQLAQTINRHLSLFIVLTGMTIFALSNHVAFGQLELKYYLPDIALKVCSLLRASGRLFWPVYYTILFFLLYFIISKYSRATSIKVLCLALIIQIVDTSAGWLPIRSKLMKEPSETWVTNLSDPFWTEAAKKYKEVHYYPVMNQAPNWSTIAYYAGINRLPTDAVYLARIDNLAIKNADLKKTYLVNKRNLDPDALYILDDPTFLELFTSIDKEYNLFSRIDGHNVIAPGWKNCNRCNPVSLEIRSPPVGFLNQLELGQPISFNITKPSNFLFHGWSTPESWGTWSNENQSTIFLPYTEKITDIAIEARAFVSAQHPKQNIIVNINGIKAVETSFYNSEHNIIKFILTDEARHLISMQGFIRLDFTLPDAISPQELGLGNDSRKLAMGLTSIVVR